MIPEREAGSTSPGDTDDDDPFPMPPEKLLGGYAQPRASYISTGRKDIEVMSALTAEHGAPLSQAGRILDFGCATGRMIRALAKLAEELEIWGTDIDANRIVWCQQHLSPPFHFVTTTTMPYLPFEDRYFGFIYAGSVFTHIDDLADAWFMELRRIVRLQGRIYVTIHDRSTIDAIAGDGADAPFSQWLREYPEYAEYARSNYGKFTIERSIHSQVFLSLDYLRQRLEPFLRIVAVKPLAYGMQTGVLLERVS
jgi:ubiquinone/menaquinone biosynthesis C-methylase UbiE